MDICDGELVRRARAGDAGAFALLVERHYQPARALAARLCAHPGEVDDIVQEAFLQAFAGLGRLRDPDRFGAWLAGIVRNVSRAAARQVPLMLLAEWPEDLHPASAQGLPSAEDLDRVEVSRACPGGSGAPSSCTTSPTCPPGRSAGRPAPPRPACTRPAGGSASTSPPAAPTSSRRYPGR